MSAIKQYVDLAAPTPAEEVKQRQGPGGKTLDYIDARFVMDRFDAAVGPGNWQDRYELLPGGSVQCGIGVRNPNADDDWIWKWDVGDQSDIEPTKGAYSDAFKRAAVKWGVGRDLYGDHARPQSAPRAPQSNAAPRPAPAPRNDAPTVVGPAASDDEEAQMFASLVAQSERPIAGMCPVHKQPWKTVAAGTSKAGKPYSEFQACPEFGCREKPR